MESLLNRLPEWIDLEKARAVAVAWKGADKFACMMKNSSRELRTRCGYIVRVWKVGWF
jgi:hypothetical protein